MFNEHREHAHRLVALVSTSLILVLASAELAAQAKPKLAAKTIALQPVPPPSPAAMALLDAAIAQGRLNEARALLAPMWASGTPDVQLRAAELALAANSLSEAEEAFSALVETALRPVALQGLGLTQLKQGNDQKAMASLQQAVALDERLARSWNGLGVLADRKRAWTDADTAYAKAIAAAPEDATYLANRGWSQLLRGSFVAAERDLVAALKLSPRLKQASTSLALARAMQGRYQEAFERSDKTTLSNDLNTIGFAAMARGDLEVAEAYFNRALALNPQFDRVAWANLQYLASLKPRPGQQP